MTEVDPNLTSASAGAAVPPPVAIAPATPPPVGTAAPPHGAPRGPATPSADAGSALEKLPPYTRSLLRVQVPVAVTLAAKRQPIAKILELGPGAILQFDKSCEEPLDLEVNGHRIGVGEAVKVGDKFGLRVTSMVLPDERFAPLRPPARS